MVKDATASDLDEEMHSALDINIPNYASAIMTTNEVVDSISSLESWESVRTTDSAASRSLRSVDVESAIALQQNNSMSQRRTYDTDSSRGRNDEGGTIGTFLREAYLGIGPSGYWSFPSQRPGRL